LTPTWFPHEQEITLNLSASSGTRLEGRSSQRRKHPATSFVAVVHIMFFLKKSKLQLTGKLKSSIYNINQKLLQISFHLKKKIVQGFKR